MTLTYFNDINVYFHMKNHYKMLKQVKSVIDTSLPQSLLKSPVAMPRLQKRWKGNTNEQLRQIYNSPMYILKRGGQVKKHNCLNSEAKSETSIRTGSIPSRSTTRRDTTVTSKESLIRSCSVGPRPTKNEKMFRFRSKKRPSASSSRSSTNTDTRRTNLSLDLEKGTAKAPSESLQSIKRSTGSKNSSTSEGTEHSPRATDNNFFKESSEEHEYLLFLLRITEDIIVNDFYSNNDIKQVFKFHIEANKHRLNLRKMRFHIGNLCNELNINCREYQNESTHQKNDEDLLNFNNAAPSHRSSYLNNEAFINCIDCSAIRTSSLYKMASLSQMPDNADGGNGDNESSISPSLLRLLEKLSLGRVTECTEPVASTSTVNSPTRWCPTECEKEGNQIARNGDESPIDFDTFVKELHSEKDNLVSKKKLNDDTSESLKMDTTALERAPVEMCTAETKNEPQENGDLTEKHSSKIPHTDLLQKKSSTILPEHFVSVLNFSSKNSKSETEIASGKESISLVNSDKYSIEFDKSSSYHSFTKSGSDKSDEEKVKTDEKTPEKNIEASQRDNVTASRDASENNMKIMQSGPVIPSTENNTGTVQNDETIILMENNTGSAQNNQAIPSMENNTEAVPNDKHTDKKIEMVQNNQLDNDTKNDDTSDKFELCRDFDDNNGDNNLIVNGSQSSAKNRSEGESSLVKNNKELDMSPIVKLVDKGTTMSEFSSNTNISVRSDQTDQPEIKVIFNLNTKDKIETVVEEDDHHLPCPSLVTLYSSEKSTPRPPTVTQPKTISIFSLESSRNPNRSSDNQQNYEMKNNHSKREDEEKQDTILKVILQGSLNDADFVMIKGPVYVYKPLLESEPRLVVFNDENNRKSRLNSAADSQRSNRTFTVPNSPVKERLDADQQVDDLLIDGVDEAIQFDQSLHTLADDSMEYILKFSKRTYNKFTDSKLLQSDYDLTPQKDLDHKYHHLMVDATTSVSGVNIKESLLLTDDYLVVNDGIQQTLNDEQQLLSVEAVKDDQKDAKDCRLTIDSYLKFKPGLFDNNYINRDRRLLASASMPKLMTKNDSCESIDVRSRCINEDLLMGYTTDLMNFDVASQDSSLRSEGETCQNEKLKRVPWSTYYN